MINKMKSKKNYLSNRLKSRLRIVVAVAVIMAIFSMLSLMVYSQMSDLRWSLTDYAWVCVVTGSIGGLLASYELIFVEGSHGRWIRRGHPIVPLGLSLLVYSTTFLVAMLLLNLVVYNDGDPNTYMGIPIDNKFALLGDVVAGTILFALIFAVFMLRRVVDGRTFGNLINGRYRRAVPDEMIFMFLDLEASTQLAEELGEVGAYNLISTFFFDIDEAILDHQGSPHRYIGDGMMITWPLKKGFSDANCLRCFFAIEDVVQRRADYYQATFGTVPKFRAGLHYGPVAVGECGDSHREVHFFGDTVNTASRIEDKCRELKQPFLASSDVVEQMIVPAFLETEDLGEFQLKGRKNNLGLQSIRRRTNAEIGADG